MERELIAQAIENAPTIVLPEETPDDPSEGPGRRISIIHGGYNSRIANFFYWLRPQPAAPPHTRLERRCFATWELIATQRTLDAGMLLRLLNEDQALVTSRPVKLEEYKPGEFTIIDGHHRLAFSLLTGSPVDAEIRSFYDAT